jgi:hypothetical protein
LNFSGSYLYIWPFWEGFNQNRQKFIWKTLLMFQWRRMHLLDLSFLSIFTLGERKIEKHLTKLRNFHVYYSLFLLQMLCFEMPAIDVYENGFDFCGIFIIFIILQWKMKFLLKSKKKRILFNIWSYQVDQ